MSERPEGPASEWPVEFHFKLQGDRELGHAGSVFAEQIAAEPCVSLVTDVSRPAGDSIRVKTVVFASSHEEAEERSDEILNSARAALGKTIRDWSKTAYWCGHDCVSVPEPE